MRARAMRNKKLHFQRYPGAETVFEYEQTMERIIHQLEMTDPEDLLPEDQYLLGVDPEDLAKASPDGRKTWRSNLETSIIVVAENYKQRRETVAEDEEDELQSFHFIDHHHLTSAA